MDKNDLYVNYVLSVVTKSGQVGVKNGIPVLSLRMAQRVQAVGFDVDQRNPLGSLADTLKPSARLLRNTC